MSSRLELPGKENNSIKFNIESGFHLGNGVIEIEVFYFQGEKKISLRETFKTGDSADVLINELIRMKEWLSVKQSFDD